jgi:hypothetical protein
MTHGTFLVNGGRPMLAHQYKMATSPKSVRVVLGGYGSGKTSAAACALVMRAAECPWTEQYGDDHPTSVVIGYTAKVIKDSSYRTFKQVCPPEFIRREWVSPGEWRVLLDNGHQVIFRTWGGAIEGLNIAGSVWIDEAHLLDDSTAFANFVARARDPLAVKTPLIIVSGIPVFGWLREYFGPESTYPDCEIIHASTYENTYLKPEVIARIKASCSSQEALTYLHGKWAALESAVFYSYDPQVHLTSKPGDRARPCHLSIDPGERSAVLWFQQDAAGNLHVVDEITPDNKSVAQIMQEVKARKWLFQPGYSRVYVDPTAGRDQLNAIESGMLPGVSVIRRNLKADEKRKVEYGIRCINAAFKDSTGKVRLTINRDLPRGPRSLIVSLPKIRRHERTGEPIKDNMTDHVALDCLRYPVTDFFPLMDNGITVA